MAALPGDRVYRGFWIDQTRGPTLGATITVRSSEANFVIAILSILVTFTGSHLWDLVAFAFYCSGVSARPRNALHHQLQILARNLTSPGAFLLETIRAAWAWRRHGLSARLTTIGTLSFLCSFVFLIIGAFLVSQVVSSSGLHVLVHSNACGWLSWRNETTSLHREYQQKIFYQARAYLETCYNKTNPLSQCNVYVQKALPIQAKDYTSCPFQGMCTDQPALRLDTGLLDSNDAFGINTELDLRVRMQRVFTCVPMRLERHFTSRPYPLDLVRQSYNRAALLGEQLLEWSLGPLKGSRRPVNSTFWQSNYTVAFSKTIDITPRAYYSSVDGTVIQGWHSSTFIPIPELRREDADTHLIAIQNNGLRFFAPNNDPLFAAHREERVYFDDNSYTTMYTADKPTSFLGCIEQMRFCFGKGDCTQLLGAGSAYVEARKIAPTKQQRAILQHMFLQAPTLYWASRAPMLVTRNSDSFQLGMPSNQWEAEVHAWVQYLLAVTQTTITHIAAGPGIVRSDFDQLAEALAWPDLCSAQRMGAPDGYSNISVFGLAVILVSSGVIIFTNLTLVPTLKYLHRRNVLQSPRIKSWLQGSILQVQRKAFEGVGYTEWIGAEADVPITKDNQPMLELGSEHSIAPSGSKAAREQNFQQPGGSLIGSLPSNLHRADRLRSETRVFSVHTILQNSIPPRPPRRHSAL